jgi:hypothetical protein
MQEVPAVQKFDEAPLTCNEYTLHFEPDRFVLDGKSIAPQFGPSGQPMHLFIAHKTMLLDPYLAKVLAQQMTDAVKKYEEQFGEITQSGAQLTARKLSEKAQTATASEKPNYFG